MGLFDPPALPRSQSVPTVVSATRPAPPADGQSLIWVDTSDGASADAAAPAGTGDLELIPGRGASFILGDFVAENHIGAKFGAHGIDDTRQIVNGRMLGMEIPKRIETFSSLIISKSETLTSGEILLSYCEAPLDIVVNSIHFVPGSTAFSGVTSVGFAIYELFPQGYLNLLASTTAGTTLPASGIAPLTTGGPLRLMGGRRYAFAALLVGTAGSFMGVDNLAPVISGRDPLAERALHEVTFTDGVLTNGSPSLTSATANFTSNDIGKSIVGTGLAVGATIASVSSTTAATMSVNSSITGSGRTLKIYRGQLTTFPAQILKTERFSSTKFMWLGAAV